MGEVCVADSHYEVQDRLFDCLLVRRVNGARVCVDALYWRDIGEEIV